MIGITEKQMLKRLRAEKRELEEELEKLLGRIPSVIGLAAIIGVFLGRLIR